MEGALDAENGVFESYLYEDSDLFVRSTPDKAKGRYARTEWRAIQGTDPVAPDVGDGHAQHEDRDEPDARGGGGPRERLAPDGEEAVEDAERVEPDEERIAACGRDGDDERDDLVDRRHALD